MYSRQREAFRAELALVLIMELQRGWLPICLGEGLEEMASMEEGMGLDPGKKSVLAQSKARGQEMRSKSTASVFRGKDQSPLRTPVLGKDC
jgi:hypothetical protein